MVLNAGHISLMLLSLTNTYRYSKVGKREREKRRKKIKKAQRRQTCNFQNKILRHIQDTTLHTTHEGEMMNKQSVLDRC